MRFVHIVGDTFFMFNLRTLQLFVAVAERLSISNAAIAMHISQSALSRQIQRLEEDLGVQLFERMGKRLSLTAEGQDLLPRVGHLLQQANGLSKGFSNFTGVKSVI